MGKEANQELGGRCITGPTVEFCWERFIRAPTRMIFSGRVLGRGFLSVAFAETPS
jgi:hypothetical protein